MPATDMQGEPPEVDVTNEPDLEEAQCNTTNTIGTENLRASEMTQNPGQQENEQ